MVSIEVYFDSFTNGRSSGGASKTTVGIAAVGVMVELDAVSSAVDADEATASLDAVTDPDDLVESER